MNTYRRLKWWHGIIFYAGVQFIQWSLRSAVSAAESKSGNAVDRTFYKKQILPIFAPPPLAFPVAWTINSTCSIAGLLHVLNGNNTIKHRRQFLWLQSAAWLLFATFNTAYFELRSPINAAIVTISYTGVTAASIVAAARMRDRLAILSLAPTAAWLMLANPVAIAQAAWNRDEFWRLGPALTPPDGLVK